MSTRPLQPPGSLPLSSALDRSEPLARLLQRLEQSRARFAAVAGILPPALRETVRAGPIDEEGWSLLAAHGAAAAKLRQLLPRLEMVLRAKGWPDMPIKVRIQPLQ
ncbi:MAG: hypothetical protein KGL43_20115 [Burkholderiales bacterium]|nr:hypothetical protein [Burkholderiales bacterium]MDE2455902.1 hypothetical protein [Burkholderiales bacterium]